MEGAIAGAYRTSHPIDNLLVRVSLRAVEPPSFAATPASAARREVVSEFAWQQKVFAPAELLAYAASPLRDGATAPGGSDALRDEYAEEVSKLVAAAGPGGADELLRVPPSGVRLFTITDRDTRLPLQVRRSAGRGCAW